jgi:hypothetical protein
MSKKTTEQRVQEYLNTYAGKNIGYPLDTQGIWEVFGEDPNCDLGGSHIEPKLGLFEGKLIDVITKVVMIPNFWAWGAGGRIKLFKLSITKVYPSNFQLEYRNEWEQDIYTVDGELVKTLTKVSIDEKEYEVTTRNVSVQYFDMGNSYSGVSDHYFITEWVFGLKKEFDLNTLVEDKKIIPISYTVGN